MERIITNNFTTLHIFYICLEDIIQKCKTRELQNSKNVNVFITEALNIICI